MGWRRPVSRRPVLIPAALLAAGCLAASAVLALPFQPAAAEEPAATPVLSTLPVPPGEDPAERRTIAALRARRYEGGEITVLDTLRQAPAFTTYLISYPADELQVTGFLNVPAGEGPFPVVILNHGYVNPATYRPGANYVRREADYLAARGYLTAGSDYRGHGNSPGTAAGGHLEPAYVIDVLNLMASVRRLPQADPARIGVWGHSMGGSISERVMVVSPDVRATVIWAGVSADAVDAWLYLRDWLRRPEEELVRRFGHPDAIPEQYRRMSARAYLADVVGPVQIHHGTADASVPYQHGQTLAEALTALGKPHEFYSYPGAPHSFSGATWDLAMRRTLAFFDTYLKAVPPP